jgi:hypothetical protein
MTSATRAIVLQPTSAIPDSVTLVTSSGTGNVTTPAGYSHVTVHAIGGGGSGFGSNSGANRAGGGGGTYAMSNPNIAVTAGVTVVYYSVGAAANDSWVNVGTNSAPTQASAGCVAKKGGNASAGTGGTGVTTGFVGSVAFAGGTGQTGNNSQGGGGAGSGGAASGPTPGAGAFPGGAGGAYNTGTGTAPGGAGGGSNSTGTNLAGAAGAVRIVFSQ